MNRIQEISRRLVQKSGRNPRLPVIPSSHNYMQAVVSKLTKKRSEGPDRRERGPGKRRARRSHH